MTENLHQFPFIAPKVGGEAPGRGLGSRPPQSVKWMAVGVGSPKVGVKGGGPGRVSGRRGEY